MSLFSDLRTTLCSLNAMSTASSVAFARIDVCIPHFVHRLIRQQHRATAGSGAPASCARVHYSNIGGSRRTGSGADGPEVPASEAMRSDLNPVFGVGDVPKQEIALGGSSTDSAAKSMSFSDDSLVEAVKNVTETRKGSLTGRGVETESVPVPIDGCEWPATEACANAKELGSTAQRSTT